MTVLKPRVRQVSIRVSDEEYECLRKHCVLVGARSISDLARSILSQATSQRGELDRPQFLEQLTSLQQRVKTLARRVERMSRASVPPEPGGADLIPDDDTVFSHSRRT